MVGNGVEPASQGAAAIQRPDPAKQDDKGSLKGVLRVGAAAEQAAADAEDERPVAPHQRRERLLLPGGDKALQELAVGEGVQPWGGHELPQVAEDGLRLPGGHGPDSPQVVMTTG